ncbi:MAG TPA: UDP-N-acetylmuramoyl-L-alanyl-D-glutamate--2,6-diaminopimelate ligase [Synergistales bacterium]|nr:UDP-N-acetylmuramoyl-L-alanyl-D-glutamate--2,6-diaminopimelate ligase [Synergistales bacterium]
MRISDIECLLAERELLKRVECPVPGQGESCVVENTELTGIFFDSRKVVAGGVFVCLKGKRFDGHDYALEASRNGAAAVISERVTPAPVRHLIVREPRVSMGFVASALFGNPADSLQMIAVTGTNGKTTTAFMLRSIINVSGGRSGILGTVIYDTGAGYEVEAQRTTPESPDIQAMLREMLDNGYSHCVMETSSHGLFQGRLSGCRFDGAVFTNLTPEHLDFHGTMEEYFNSKLLLFRKYMRASGWVGVSNVSDPYGMRIKDLFPEQVVSFSLDRKDRPDYFAEIRSMSLSGIRMDILSRKEGRLFELFLPLTGRFNALNALGAAALSLSMGLEPEVVRRGLETMPQVPGRLQCFRFSNGVTAIIDYAHTPDALQNVLLSVRDVCRNKVWVVFGSGGDRFKGNRPLMGKVATALADHVVITMDNPRSEDPSLIARDILAGVNVEIGAESYPEVILDRREAIYSVLDRASGGDAVIIAGKGPERNIVFSDRIIPYSDGETVGEWSLKRGIEWSR